MTVGQAIQLARELKRIDEVNYPDALMVQFINECEGKIQTEFLHIAPVDCQQYTTDDLDKDLIIGPPHDKLYYTYLCAMIDFTNGEYTKYNNAIIIANSFMAEWAAWFNRTHRRDGREFLGVFLSAYGIAVKWGYVGTEEEWLDTLKGDPGPQGPQGPQGVPGTVEFDSLTEEQLALLRGEPGPPGLDGKDGEPGADGFSPVVSITEINGGHRVAITDANGVKNFDVLDGADGQDGQDGQDGSPGKDGVSPAVSVSAITGGHRVAITDANGTKYFDVMDGKDGSGGGTGGGADGEDGFSPIVTITQIEGGHRITIEDLNGPQSFDVLDGADGQDGSPGEDGEPGADGVSVVSVEQTTTSTEDGGVNVVTVTLSDGSKATFQVKNGSRGSAGVDGSNGTNGQDGYTPVRGTDYWTEADKAQMVSDVLAALPTWEGGSY